MLPCFDGLQEWLASKVMNLQIYNKPVALEEAAENGSPSHRVSAVQPLPLPGSARTEQMLLILTTAGSKALALRLLLLGCCRPLC